MPAPVEVYLLPILFCATKQTTRRSQTAALVPIHARGIAVRAVGIATHNSSS
jgi:hypothetical protein